MNTQEQQIEEMAVIGCVLADFARTAKECSKCDFKQGICNAYRHAERLYNAGYRKIDCDDYVTLEWHNEQIAHAEDVIERLKAENDALRNDLINAEGNLTHMTELYGEAKTEAVREFAEKLKALA